MAKTGTLSTACRKKLNTLFRSLPEDVKSHGRKTQYFAEIIFDKLIKDAFKFKRKNLRNNLKGYDLK